MKIFIDGFGVVAHAITRKLIENHDVDPKNIYVNTYKLKDNAQYINFIQETGVSYSSFSYSVEIAKKIFDDFSPDILMSLYGRRIIPDFILSLPKIGNFNLHPSLLPEYKGCFSGPWAIINNETHTGITIHEMIASVDCGEILYQEKIKIDERETGYSIWHKTASRFVNIFDDFFVQYLEGSLKKKPMADGGTYYPRRLPFDGLISEEWEDAKQDAFIRAMHFPPLRGALLKRGGKSIEVESLKQLKRLVKS